VTGGVGFCTSYYITGWAHRYVGPAIDLTITVNGVPTGTVKPWIARRDVKEVLGRDDALGFFFVASLSLPLNVIYHEAANNEIIVVLQKTKSII
jgi:hypothetical protein